MTLIAQLKDSKELHAAAEDYLKLLNSSIGRFESLVAGLDQDIARQEAYLKARGKISDDVDFPLESLRKRHGNLTRSLETLRVRLPAAQLALQESAERLTRLVNELDRTLDDEAAIPDTAEQ